MSTSASVYNVTNKTFLYLDSAFWMSAPFERLLTATKLRGFVSEAIRHKDPDDRGKVWLEGLMKWIRDDGLYIIIPDTNHEYPFFIQFKRERLDEW